MFTYICNNTFFVLKKTHKQRLSWLLYMSFSILFTIHRYILAILFFLIVFILNSPTNSRERSNCWISDEIVNYFAPWWMLWQIIIILWSNFFDLEKLENSRSNFLLYFMIYIFVNKINCPWTYFVLNFPSILIRDWTTLVTTIIFI